jgi:Uncharacterized protein conserved in bacteria (DUF2325)
MHMNDAESGTLPGWTFGIGARCCAPAAKEAAEGTGSRRRRLWELGGPAHCPVIGVCLPLAAMRRLARKVLGGEPVADDYELHCGMVADCKQRCRLAEAVQRELDRRFMIALRQAAAARSTAALAAWWSAQGASKDLPGALWATLTHARCTAALERLVLGQVHMLQHQVGMATRVELARFEALIDENAVLTRERAGMQQRCTRQAAEHAERCESLQAEVLRLRGQHMAAQSQVALLNEDLQALREAVPGLESRRALVERNAAQGERITQLQRTLQQALDEVERLRAGSRDAHTALTAADLQAKEPPANEPAPIPPTDLSQRAVLCVGGRTASVPIYRRLIEGQGRRFLHHDGGEEQSSTQLESTLAAADLVICQTGCVSHNAYWRVKDHCKRTGKRCVFVETPSASGLQRALAEIGNAI